MVATAGRDVVRALTDERVVTALIDRGAQSRADLAAAADVSRPTSSESVRRLVELGVARETTQARQGAGRAGNLVDLGPAVGTALSVVVAPDGVTTEVLDVRGQVVAARRINLRGTAMRPSAAVRRALRGQGGGPYVAATVSVADPVDRTTGRAVELADAPFLTGSLDPRKLLAGLVTGPIEVDNDVNWAARAELAAGAPDDFAYLHLGEGLGGAIVSDGAIVHGGRGLVGEVAHIVVAGPRGKAMPLTEVFAKLGLRQHDSTAVDVSAVLRLLDRDPGRVVRALAGVVAGVVAFADPSELVIGGPWAVPVVAPLRAELSSYPREVVVREARVPDDAPSRGVRDGAIALLRERVLEQVRGTLGP
ncbi:ROK family transcriptional regulator [Flexivirga meconopsidis]|uniref:ROK family transcriptional regulator n=1 Tax=Flexivirga meconopsidis TaxID=2977121 RepID=UPI00223EDAAB